MVEEVMRVTVGLGGGRENREKGEDEGAEKDETKNGMKKTKRGGSKEILKEK